MIFTAILLLGNFTIKEYKNHLDQIMIASDSGEIGYTTEEAKSKINRK